jgi:hypothetical protein
VTIELNGARVDLAEGLGARALARIEAVDRELQGLARRSGKPVFKPVLRLLTRLQADAMAAVGRLTEALALAREAVALARSEQGSNAVSADTGETLLELAEFEQRAGDPLSAMRDATDAARMLEPALGLEHPKAQRARHLARI